jgi:hypothetical protein
MSGGGSGQLVGANQGERNVTKIGNIITKYSFGSNRRGRGETNQSGQIAAGEKWRGW